MSSKLDKYKKYEKFVFPKEHHLNFKIPKKFITYGELYSICMMCAKGVAVDIAFKAAGKSLAFKVGSSEARFYQEEDWAMLLDFCYCFYYQSLAQVSMNIHTIAISNDSTAVQAARMLLEYEKALRDDDERKRKMLI